MRRFGLLIATALSFAAVGSASAWACVDPGIGVSQDPVGPGDPVYYTITDMRSGAFYEVKAGNDVVVSRRQTLTNDAVKGSFPMPDAGPSPTSVSVQVIVEHGDIENADQTLAPSAPSPIKYAGDAQPSSQPSATPAPPQGTSPASQTVQHTDAAGTPPAAPPTSQSQPAVAPRSPGGGPTRAPHPVARSHVAAPRHAARAHQRAASVRRAVVVAPPSVEPIAPAPVVLPSAPAVRVRPERTAEPVVVPLPEVAARVTVPRAIEQRARPPVEQPEATHDYAFVVLAIALAVAITTRRHRGWGRRPAELSPSPRPPEPARGHEDLAIEAELQEIIAEERARERARSGVP